MKSILLLIGLLAFSALCLFLSQEPSRAHDAPAGWSYPFACCSGIDCRPLAKEKITERPDGFVVKATGEMIAIGDTRIRNSPDGEYHWCSVAGEDDGRTICLFVPPRGY